MEISDSEKFTSGLLLVMAGNNIMLSADEKLVAHISNKWGLENLAYETVRCENDGNTLLLYNTSVSKNDLETISPK